MENLYYFVGLSVLTCLQVCSSFSKSVDYQIPVGNRHSLFMNAHFEKEMLAQESIFWFLQRNFQETRVFKVFLELSWILDMEIRDFSSFTDTEILQ